jgi:hypothetical protein
MSLVNADAAIPEGDYYVTVRDAGRTGFLLGPYTDYLEVLANIDRGRKLAQAADCRAVFYAFGHSRLPVGTPCRTVFG